MIDLLGEAKNYMNLYQFALLVDEGAESLSTFDKGKFFLDIPASPKNPELLKRALLLTAGWRLFHQQPKLTFSDTVAFLDEWYQTVMRLASKMMDDKKRKQTLDFVKTYRNQYRNSETRFVNLDKINYYRLVCQAQANGPLESRRIVIPDKMIEVWKERKVSKIDRGLHILYHYCGEMPRVTKTEIEVWLRGGSGVMKSNEILSHALSPGGDGGRTLFLTVDEAFRWREGEEGVEVPETPRFADRLSDDNLQRLRIESDPAYWLRELVASTEEMMSLYQKKRDLGRVTEPKTARLKRCALVMLYAAAANFKSSDWKGWDAVLPYVPWNEKVALNWKEIEQWALENHSVVIPLADSARTFFKGRGENAYFAQCAKAEPAIVFSRKV